ncbi:MAG: capsule assembly Wzi family protein [Candidatus Loosdrechtia sp.]|uniref:capsule assembly Wzi family protein n=1 Tax=Candidatus Loosdrechtia sp. TaxID=3101272 RepID=UPI003A64149F|nr:MAG: capsule assembly Wzi family protein [Candidatus Jettenia sp. AMX2]
MKTYKAVFYFLFSFFFLLQITGIADAGDRTNVPLKNWGGFAINRSWIYDALEKIVLAGLADQVILNTKPMSRMEVARIVAQAVRRIEQDQGIDYHNREHIEELLYKLVREFSNELAEMGVRTPLNRDGQARFLALKPVDHLQFGGAYAHNPQRPVTDLGKRFNEGANTHVAFDGRHQLGDFLSFYYHPELSYDKDSTQGRLVVGYTKLTLWNTELEIGRDSLWWGPGFRGSMLFSNNAPPLNQVRLGAAEPFRLPWVFSHLGPIKATTFVGQLERNRDDWPKAFVGGYRISLAPSRFLEIGHGRAYQFGGEGKGYSLKDFPATVGEITRSTKRKGENHLMSLDATLRMPDVNRYILIARDMSLYGEMGWDDTRKGWIRPKKPGGLIGAYLTGFLGDPWLDFRVEYTKTTSIMFTHHDYTDGFTYRDAVLSHFVGTDGNELYGRISRWIGDSYLMGFNASRSEMGPTQRSKLNLPREKRYTAGIDFSCQVTNSSSVFLRYDYSRIYNHNFTSGEKGHDHLFRIEYTYSF